MIMEASMPSNKEDAEDRYYEESEKYAEELEKQVPDLISIIEDPGFFKWLEQKDKYTGKSRKDLYDEACNKFDAEKVAFLFKQFKQFREKKDRPKRTGYKRGDFIGQKYEVYDVLGMGGFGIVYLVYMPKTKSVRALKTFRDEYIEDEQTKERFQKEAKVWIDLERHPYLVRAHLVDKISDRLFIVMEYIAPDEKGLNSLDGYLRHQPPDLTQSLRWAIQFCYGMEYAYSKGIRAHRDIKPANIMIGHDKTVKISDFGLAGGIGMLKTMSGIKLDIRQDRIWLSCQTREGLGFGTPTPMPPEQFTNSAGCDEKSDIYSFGIVLYQMATGGRFPFLPALPQDNSVEESIRFWNEMYRMHSEAPVPKLNSPLFPIIQRCINKKPDKRYSSFRELRSDLEPLLKKLTGEIIKLPELKELKAWEWRNKGVSLKTLGKNQEAISCLDQALRLNPDDAGAWLHKGIALVKLGKLQEAMTCYDRVLEINPEDAMAWYDKGFTLDELGDYQEAIGCFDQALRLNPDDAGAWLHKGIALVKLGKLQEAITCYDRALEINPVYYAFVWLEKGILLSRLGKPQEAIDCYSKALETQPEDFGIWSAKGDALRELGEYREASDCYSKALEIYPEDPTAWNGKALVEDKLGRKQDAAFSYKRFIELASTTEYQKEIEYARQRLKDLTKT